LRQTIKPIEIIVVDDTPTEVIKVVAHKYKLKFKDVDSKLIYIKKPRERSAAIALNIGSKIARGEIIMILDSDVTLHHDYIKKIVEVFKKNPTALGVQGWIVNTPRNHLLIRVIKTIFRLQHYVKDSCKLWEYPYLLTHVIPCQYLHGSNMAVKRDVLTKFSFDETLKKSSPGEDLLFSHSIYRNYPDSLYISPHAKCLHKESKEESLRSSKKGRTYLRQCNKYVLVKLFGAKGAFIYFRQSTGALIMDLIVKILFILKKRNK
jgi:cellulose synthase/poly-beta-1,6-N-acetylglucosamine synthase-like glycosyltransferase